MAGETPRADVRHSRSASQLREDALGIWHAALEAVRSDRLVAQAVRREGHTLFVEDAPIDLREIERIAVVGAGKAGAGMAAGLEQALGAELLQDKQVHGWVNVPADCVRPLQRIHLHAARPAGLNEPTEAGVHGSEQILRIVSCLTQRDLCLCLISGGGSALLPAPIDGVTLGEKQALTRFLSAAGANIEELNTVRKQISRIKGGGLRRACRAGRLITLVISDVIGDPLDVIASGPTVDDRSTPRGAIDVLIKYQASQHGFSPIAAKLMRELPRTHVSTASIAEAYVIGNNALAVDAAGAEAVRRGYSPAMTAAQQLEGPAEGVGQFLATMALQMRQRPGPDCLISGGEPVVRLAPVEVRGKGGRNQQLVLAALERLGETTRGIALLSGGTDGEDGPTDAAGAFLDEAVAAAAKAQGLRPGEYLARNDAYHFFQATGGLIVTGPTHTNVCDLRVVVVNRE